MALVAIVVVFFVCVTATLLAFGHRTPAGSPGQGVRRTLAWLVGTVGGIFLIVFVASLAGLTGA